MNERDREEDPKWGIGTLAKNASNFLQRAHGRRHGNTEKTFVVYKFVFLWTRFGIEKNQIKSSTFRINDERYCSVQSPKLLILFTWNGLCILHNFSKTDPNPVSCGPNFIKRYYLSRTRTFWCIYNIIRPVNLKTTILWLFYW